jgi:glycerol uptake facilitator-like aquaporin
VAVAAVALVTAFVMWLAALHSTDETSGLALANPAAAATLTAVRRFSASALLPIIAAQVVGAVAGGFAALALDEQLAGSLAWSDASPVATGVVVAVFGIVAAWTVLAIDGGENVAWGALGPLLSGSALGVGLTAALNPATVLGLATAGIVGWLTAGIAAVVGLIAAAVGAYVISAITPAE